MRWPSLTFASIVNMNSVQEACAASASAHAAAVNSSATAPSEAPFFTSSPTSVATTSRAAMAGPSSARCRALMSPIVCT